MEVCEHTRAMDLQAPSTENAERTRFFNNLIGERLPYYKIAYPALNSNVAALKMSAHFTLPVRTSGDRGIPSRFWQSLYFISWIRGYFFKEAKK